MEAAQCADSAAFSRPLILAWSLNIFIIVFFCDAIADLQLKKPTMNGAMAFV